MRRLLYYKMRQILQNAIVLLQNRTAFAKLDVTYKMRSCSIRGVLTGIFFITTKPNQTNTHCSWYGQKFAYTSMMSFENWRVEKYEVL